MHNQKKITVVYDWIDKWGGVERVLLALNRLFPQARFVTTAYDLQAAPWARRLSLTTTFMQRIPPFFRRRRALMMPLYPLAFESLTFNNTDVVISITSSFGKSIITSPSVFHLSYILTPPRYLWGDNEDYLSATQQFLLSPYITYLRQWDKYTIFRPDKLLCISKTVAQRCRDVYGVENAEVLYPPFDHSYWTRLADSAASKHTPVFMDIKKPYFLVVSRLERYKRVDIPIDYFSRKSDSTLVVVGTGSLIASLKRRARGNIVFLERVSDPELASLYAGAQALIMPQEEDFGYVALEAIACGCPVLAYGKGGAKETVQEGISGMFMEFQHVDALHQVLERYMKISYNLREQLRKNRKIALQEYDERIFQKRISSLVSNYV